MEFQPGHGYALLVLGLLLEGETVLVLGSWSAQRGLLDIRLVYPIAVAAAWCSDQALFWLGRWKGAAAVARSRRMAAALERARALVLRYPHACVLGVRFAWGMRTVGPVLIGASHLPPWQFLALSALAAPAWAAVYCALGWFFGAAAQRLLGQAVQVQATVLGVAAAIGVGVWWWRRRRRR